MKTSGSQPTMKDVAREAGVALGTVSKVFNGIPVGESYRRKVEAAAQKLGYQVNSYARGLKTNQTCSVALLFPTLLHPYFAAMAEELTAVLMGRGYRAVLMVTNYDPESERKCVAMVRQNKIDGIIAMTYTPGLEIDSAIPFVTIDRHYSANIPCVSSDNFAGGQMAAQRLLELGCRKLLFLRIGSDIASEPDKRGAGFEAVCRMRGVLYESIILHDSDTEEPFFRYLEAHIRGGTADFDGIFCNTDVLALRVGAKLRELGVRVPEEVQIIGFDGVNDFVTGVPPCSTIVQPVAQIAAAAVEILLSKERSALPALLCLPVRYEAHGTTKE